MINQSSLRQMLSLPGFAATLIRKSYDVRRVEITPLEQRKVTFDTHALVKDLEAHGKWYLINNLKENFLFEYCNFECYPFSQSINT